MLFTYSLSTSMCIQCSPAVDSGIKERTASLTEQLSQVRKNVSLLFGLTTTILSVMNTVIIKVSVSYFHNI